jgi:D-alanyl-lipoteichoic acid acyltransferase DltB (MBOAT superfamily)
MLFNSLTFILAFLPIALAGYYLLALLGNRWAAAWLVAVSFLFYTWWSPLLVFLLGGSIVFNFLCGALILRTQNQPRTPGILLTLGICGDLLLLIYYKYLFSLLNWLGFHGLIHLSHSYHVILPLGISFFTFTQIGYLVDCRGGIVKTNRPLDYCLFVTFFPHLIAGPILHHREMMPQFANPETYRLHFRNLAVGSTLFVMGLAKKVLFADHFAPFVGIVFSHPHDLGFFHAWEGVLSYSLQLYFDFSGYSDMACGLALLFGLRFPANFNSPYRAPNIIDFWQRWHMTLTRYITLYIFSPIALWVSRRRIAQGKSVAKKAISTPGGFLSMIALPTFFTMLLAGVWHGAGPTFLVFGLLHATYLIINHAWRSFGPRVPVQPPHPVLRVITDVAKIVLTYLAVVLAEIVFRAASLHDALRILHEMTGLDGFSYHGDPATVAEWDGSTIVNPLLFFGLFGVVWFMPNSLQILDKFEPTLSKIVTGSLIRFEWRPTLAWSVMVGAVAVLTLLAATGMTEFLYFRF